MSMFLNVAKYFSRAMTGSYALSLILFLLGHFLIGEKWLVIAFFNNFAQLILLPSFLLLPICLLLRQWRLAAAFIPSILFFAFTWGSLLLPNQSIPVAEDAQILRVLSFNIGTAERDNQDIIDMIRSENADIVALQELSIDMARVLEGELGDLYPYMAFHPTETIVHGQGLMSRFFLSEDDYWRYNTSRFSLGNQSIAIEELSLKIYNVHLSHPGVSFWTRDFFNPSFRSEELADVLERAASENNRVVLIGDFNMPDLSGDYAAIRQDYQDAFWELGTGFGWTFAIANSPAFLRLDYLFYRGGLEAISAEVVSNRAGSDHHPLLVEMRLKDDY